MYVCLCTGVTSDQIQEAIRNGARTAAEITATTGAGSNCGSCLNTVIALMLKEVSVETGLVSEPLPVPSAGVFPLPMLSAAA